MKYQIGILDVDVSYSMALMEYVNMRAKVPLQIHVFTDTDKLMEFMKFQPIDLLLVGEDERERKKDLKLPCKQLFLTDKQLDLNNEKQIYRYQNMSKVIDAILKELPFKGRIQGKENSLIAFYSPIGRCGKTTLAKMFCENLEKYIFVSWEGFTDSAVSVDKGARFLYCMKSRKSDFDGMLEAFDSEGRVIIDEPIDYRDVRQINCDDVRWLRDIVCKGRDGVCVVFDIGNTMLGDLNLLKEFDCVYMPTLSDEVSKKKMEHWNSLATSQWKTSVSPSIHRIDVTNQNLAEVFANISRGGSIW